MKGVTYMRRNRIPGENGLAPVGLLPLSIVQLIAFWIFPIFPIIFSFFGYVDYSAYMHIYIVFTVIAVAVFYFAVRTANKSYRVYGVSVATAILSGFNALGGGFMILFNYLQSIK